MSACRATALPPKAEGELYYADLVGLAVVNRQGVRLGQVSQGAGLRRASGAECDRERDGEASGAKPAVERMIPFVAAYVDAVDVAAGRIDVDWQADYLRMSAEERRCASTS